MNPDCGGKKPELNCTGVIMKSRQRVKRCGSKPGDVSDSFVGKRRKLLELVMCVFKREVHPHFVALFKYATQDTPPER